MFETRKMLFDSWFEMIILLSLDLMHLSAGSPIGKFIQEGEFIKVETMPHAVVIMRGRKWPTDLEVCSGSILNNRWVLTVSICVQDLNPRDGHIKMRFGIDDYTQEGPVIDVMSAVCLNRYPYPRSEFGDICLLQTFDEIPFSEKVQPVALPLANETLESISTVRVVGWGQMSEIIPIQEYLTTRLRAVDIPIIELRQCDVNEDVVTYDDLFCAGDRPSRRGLCDGDAGSPAVIKRSDNRTWVALGVAYSYTCLGPSAFVSVGYHASWIKRQLKRFS